MILSGNKRTVVISHATLHIITITQSKKNYYWVRSNRSYLHVSEIQMQSCNIIKPIMMHMTYQIPKLLFVSKVY